MYIASQLTSSSHHHHHYYDHHYLSSAVPTIRASLRRSLAYNVQLIQVWTIFTDIWALALIFQIIWWHMRGPMMSHLSAGRLYSSVAVMTYVCIHTRYVKVRWVIHYRNDPLTSISWHVTAHYICSKNVCQVCVPSWYSILASVKSDVSCHNMFRSLSKLEAEWQLMIGHTFLHSQDLRVEHTSRCLG